MNEKEVEVIDSLLLRNSSIFHPRIVRGFTDPEIKLMIGQSANMFAGMEGIPQLHDLSICIQQHMDVFGKP